MASLFSRTWKRKLEGDKPQAFSPSKRQYGSPFSQRSNSPLRPLMQETPSIPFLTNSPSSSSASPKASKNTNDGDKNASASTVEPEKDDLIHRIMQISEKSIDSSHVTPPPPRRNIEPRNVEEDLRSLRGRGRFARGSSSLSWRNSPQLQDDFSTNAGGNFRGHRGSRGKFRGRGRGNFNQFGQQQQQLYGETNVNDRQQPPGNLPAFNVVDTEQSQGARYADGSYGLQRPTPFGDNSRVGGSPYNYQAVSHGGNRNLAPEYIPQDNIHLERQQQQQQQQNIHVVEGHQQNFDQRFSPMRHSSPSPNRFGKPVQDWQNQGPYSPYSGQVSPNTYLL